MGQRGPFPPLSLQQEKKHQIACADMEWFGLITIVPDHIYYPVGKLGLKRIKKISSNPLQFAANRDVSPNSKIL